MSTSQQVVLITGCSSGVGLYLAVILAANPHYKVYATMRDTNKDKELKEVAAARNCGERLVVKSLDVTIDSSVEKCVQEIVDAEGRIDVLVNNAGFGFAGSIETIPIEEGKKNFETNVWGVMRVTKAVLPVMRKHKSGRVITVSSVGGIYGTPFNDVYCAGKFAVEGMMESLAPVYKKIGIHAILVEPGAIVTKFIENAERHLTVPDLEALQNTYYMRMKERFTNPATFQTGEQVAEVIKGAIEDPEPKLRYQTNPAYSDAINGKLADPTGNLQVKISTEKLLS